MKTYEAFKIFTNYKKTKSRHTVECVKGLWGVDAPSKEEAESEGFYYFVQYWNDGEYDDLLKD